MFLIKPQR